MLAKGAPGILRRPVIYFLYIKGHGHMVKIDHIEHFVQVQKIELTVDQINRSLNDAHIALNRCSPFHHTKPLKFLDIRFPVE